MLCDMQSNIEERERRKYRMKKGEKSQSEIQINRNRLI